MDFHVTFFLLNYFLFEHILDVISYLSSLDILALDARIEWFQLCWSWIISILLRIIAVVITAWRRLPNRINNNPTMISVMQPCFINTSLSLISSNGHHQQEVNSINPELLYLLNAMHHHLLLFFPAPVTDYHYLFLQIPCSLRSVQPKH